MTLLAPGLTEQLIVALADELTPRLAAELAGQLPLTPAAETWRLLDVEEAAERLGRSTRWVRERAKRGDLAFVRLDGGAFAFEEDDLRAFAQTRRVSVDESGSLAARLQGGRDRASGSGLRAADRVGNRRVQS